MRFHGAIFDVDGVLVATPYKRTEQIEAGQFVTYDDALRLVLSFKAMGLKLGAVSVATNDDLFLQHVPIGAFAAREREINAVGGDMDGSIDSGMDIETFGDSPVETLHIPLETTLLDVFDASLGGGDVVAVAQTLGVAPESCILITNQSTEGATEARGMFRIGIARHDDEEALRAAGIDLVVTSLDDIEVEKLLAD